jgi:hypothetical protein
MGSESLTLLSAPANSLNNNLSKTKPFEEGNTAVRKVFYRRIDFPLFLTDAKWFQ